MSRNWKKHSAVRRYDRATWRRGGMFNRLVATLKRDGCPLKVVPRDDDVWMVDNRVSYSEPTVHDRVIGQDFILACECADVDWQLYTYRPTSQELLDLSDSIHARYLNTLEEIEDYHQRYGGIDWWHPFGYWAERKVRIGDEVQTLSEMSDLDLIYGEPEEDRPDLGFDPERYDGDDRYQAQDLNAEVWFDGRDTRKAVMLPSGKLIRVRQSGVPVPASDGWLLTKWQERCDNYRSRK